MAVAEQSRACFRLAAACCRWPGDVARDRAVIAAAADIRDWPLFLREIRRHRVDALAQAALSAAAVALPDEVASALRRRAQAAAQRSLLMAAETARLQALLTAAAIPALALKGVTLAQLAYRSIALKLSQDIDFLVAPERAREAIDVLQRDGYRLLHPTAQLSAPQNDLLMAYGREVSLQGADGRYQVELRWQLVNSPSLLRGVDAHSSYQDVALAGATSVRTLQDDDLFAYLCVHGAGHGWSRLQWLADLNAYVAGRDEATLLGLYQHAKMIGAGPCALTALALCQRLFGCNLPADIARGVRGSVRAKLAAAMALDLMRGPDVTETGARRFGTTRVVLMQLLFASGPRHYLSLVRELGFRLDDMLAWPLPRALHFVYPLARLPLWLWRKMMSAARRSQDEAGSA